MDATSWFLLVIVIALLFHINRGRFDRWLAHKAGNFDVYRVFTSGGGYSYRLAYSDDERFRLLKDLCEYRTSGLPYVEDSALVDFRLITPAEYASVDIMGGKWEAGDIEKSSGIQFS